MKLLSYEFSQSGRQKWNFLRAEFGRINLIVGDTGSGKTRYLNTIFNLGSSVSGQKILGANSSWKIELEQDGTIYGWEIDTEPSLTGQGIVKRERLWKKSGSKVIEIIERSKSSFYFGGTKIPMLPIENTSIFLLKREQPIKALYSGFSTIMRRRFDSDALDALLPVFADSQTLGQRPKNLDELFRLDSHTNIKLHVLERSFPEIYEGICKQYAEIFPFITSVSLKDVSEVNPRIKGPGMAPVFCIKERNVSGWIPVDQLSSGMKKVLLIISDVASLPEGGIYLIDEYENSLGIGAIDFLPSFLSKIEKQAQFFITSHHPYLINNVPPVNWLVFHRRGPTVTIKYGPENAARYGKSKQKHFVQLINDPFYVEGVE